MSYNSLTRSTRLITPLLSPTNSRSASFLSGSMAKLFKTVTGSSESSTSTSGVEVGSSKNVGDGLYDDLAKDLGTQINPLKKVSTWHKSSTANFKSSQRKLNDLSRLIAGKGVDEGVLQLKVSPKKSSSRLLSMLALARDHAIAKGLNRDKLVIAQSWTTKGPSLKRVDIKGRGRRGIKFHNSSKLHVLLAEGLTKEEKRREHKLKGWRMSLRGLTEGDGVGVGSSRPIINATHYWKW